MGCRVCCAGGGVCPCPGGVGEGKDVAVAGGGGIGVAVAADSAVGVGAGDVAVDMLKGGVGVLTLRCPGRVAVSAAVVGLGVGLESVFVGIAAGEGVDDAVLVTVGVPVPRFVEIISNGCGETRAVGPGCPSSRLSGESSSRGRVGLMRMLAIRTPKMRVRRTDRT